MMLVKPIRSESDYEANLARLGDLIDAVPDTPEGDELEVLATLIERYENDRYPIALPTPLAAIRFRMEQGNLTPRDLEEYIGSRARVSEVLSGTRPLSIGMIRSLNEHLGIPAEVLIRPEPRQEERASVELAKPAAKQLLAWGLMQAKESFEAFMARGLGGGQALAMLRKTRTERTNAKTDFVAVQAWCAAVLLRAENATVTGPFDLTEVRKLEIVRTLAKLSIHADGPRRAQQTLSDLGIILVILPHLPGTHLDGAALRRPKDGAPVIALTLRRDRIDNFWFTLLHELAHVAFHLTDDRACIVDELDIGSSEAIEMEADELAGTALIPDEQWEAWDVKGTYTGISDILAFARKMEVNPAIVAGRWQKTHRDYRKFSKLLGHGTVRPNFTDLIPGVG
ncbi:ImmA/IrrE family metallo-endopeptidase [Phenylobacterium ferrooxidans]|uniref:ImmA/IrrE family metallo-endopeptidase n=1 Tax=Phenylobacterium ferrooxidans TaxID=2982689 RepID=A0ABW6CVN9_9CAUL